MSGWLPLQPGTGLLLIAALAALGFTGQQPDQILTQPVPAPPTSPAPRRSGVTLFIETGCAHCHGTNAGGSDKGPSLLGIGRTWSREKIEHQIHDGGSSMPAFGSVLNDADTQSLIDFIESTKVPAKIARKRVIH